MTGKTPEESTPIADAAAFLGALPPEERDSFSRYSGVGLPEDVDDIAAALAAHPGSIVDLLSVSSVRASTGGDVGFALKLGQAATELARNEDEAQVAHVCLAQVYFRGRKDPEHLEAFERHCLKAVELGHAGTFCYERLAVLYEHRGELSKTVELCERAVRVLSGAGDERSADSFRKRLDRVRRKQAR